MIRSDAAKDPEARDRDQPLLSSNWTRDPQTGKPVARWTARDSETEGKFHLPFDAYPQRAGATGLPKRSRAETTLDIAFALILVSAAGFGAWIFPRSPDAAYVAADYGSVVFDAISGSTVAIVVAGLLAWPVRDRIKRRWHAPAAERVFAAAPRTGQAAGDAANPAV